jgi:exopolysaccharide production protein ExoZ
VQQTSASKILSIQWLRAIAALAVVAFHASLQLESAFSVGTAGVDVFFIVSGYIMWTVTRRGQRPGVFVMNRLVRIVPLYWLATGVMIAGALVGLFPSVVLTAGHIAGSLFFAPHVSPSNGHVWPLLVQGWTLNYEMFFYVVFALALFAPRRAQVWIICAVLAALALLGLAAAPDDVLATFYTNPIMLEFAAGAVLARAAEGGVRLGRWLSLALIVAAAAGFALGQSYSVLLPRFVAFGAPALILVIGFLGLEHAGVSFDWRPAVFVGDASYAIYLFHTFAISALGKVIDIGANPVLGVTLSFAASVFVGGAVYLLADRPLAALLRPERRRALWAALRGARLARDL